MTSNNKYDVGQMLTDIHLEIYHPLFQTSGYRTVSDCTQINHEILQTMGISLTGHRKRILSKLQELLKKAHWTLEDTTVDTVKTNEDNSLEQEKNSPLLGQNVSKSSVVVKALPGECSKNSTNILTDYMTVGESVSTQSTHNQDMFPEQSDISGYETTLDFREKTDLESSSFFEFQGAMIDNDLYATRDESEAHKPQTKKGPTRSFILRNRPVPDLPVSVSNTSYSRHSGEVMTCANPKGDCTISVENKQSGDESSNPISPYEETFFFSNSESTKEATGETSSVSCSDGTGSSESLQNSQCKTPPNAVSSAVNGGSEESIYSTLDECTHEVGIKPGEDLRSQSLPVGLSQSDTIISKSSESGVQEEFSISPYASFYGPCTITKVGWLDKLSPHSTGMFQKRWVKFDGRHISYYHNDRDVFSRGKILLSAVIKMKKLGDNKFEILTSQRTFVFRAEKEALRHDWLTILEQSIKEQANKSSMASDGDKSGYLDLKGYKIKIFTVIDGSKLCLSKSKQEYNAGIVITDITMTMATLKNTDRKSFEITTPFRNFCFTADSEREKQDWIETLEQSIAETVADYEVAEKIWFNESNRSCADCRAPNPDWASINLGVVICRSCAGQHRALGSKVSKVHNLKLNTSMWTNELVELFIVLGNEKVNSFWEANLLPEKTLPATTSINQRRLFVTQKYKEGRFKKMLSPGLSSQQLNEALCAAVTKADVLETMILVFSGADVMCTTGDPAFSTPYLLAKMAGQRLQMEFLHHNRFSDYQAADYQTKNGNNQNLFYCGFLYKSSSSSKLSTTRKIKEDMTKWWCTIENSLLSYYEDENITMPEGCIDLSEAVCLVVQPSDFILDSGAIFTFEIYLLSERMFLFGAENAESQREWAKALSKNFVPTINESLVELEFEAIGFLYYKDSYTLMEWKEGWFALEKASLHYSLRQENFQRETVQLKKLQELTKTSSIERGEKRNALLLVENGRTLYIHGHTVLDFMVWHRAIEKAAGTDGNALQDQQLCKNNIPIIVNSCMAFVTQYGLGSKSLYLKCGNPLKVKELLEDFKKDARSIKLKVGKHQLEDVTDVLKYFLDEIDDALLTKELYPYWISALDIQDEQERVLKYKNLIDTLPALNKATLAALIEHLYRIQKCSDVNQLDTHVVAQTFSNCLFQTKGHHDEEVCVVQELIKFYAEIFDVSELQLKQMDIENRFITKWNDAQVLIPQSGDLLLDVYLERKDPDMCVIIRVSSAMIAAELTSCVAAIKNTTLSNEMFWTTFEVIENGELERPMHFKEKVLETVLGWSLLTDPGSAYLLVKPFVILDHLIHLDKNPSRHIQSGNMKYKEDSSKLLSGNKFQERYFVLRERKLLIYKDIKSIKPEKVLPVVVCKFFIGVKRKMKPPTRFGLTACFEKHQWHLCCDTQEAQMEWMISILSAQCAGDFFPRSKTEQTLTVKSLPMGGLYGNTVKDITIIQPMPMSEKTRRKVRPAISKEELTSTVQKRMSMMAEVFDSKEERLMNQKKHYSLVDLDSPKNYSGDTKELDTIDVKRLHNPTDQLNKELSASVQLPQNVIKELNLVLRKSRKDLNECL